MRRAKAKVHDRFPGIVSIAVVMAAIAAVACASPHPATAERPLRADQVAELWTSAPPVHERDLYWGVGGPELAPKPNTEYELVSEKKDIFAYTPGYHVRDAEGRRWTVKLGDEVRPEVLASRIVWAAGYRQAPVYLVPEWTLVQDGERKRMPAARFRLSTKDFDKKGGWSWQENPFVGTRPYNGLLVLMAVLGNWDVEDHNTAIYKPGPKWGDAKRWLVVKDVGASFSQGGGAWLSGTRNDTPGYLEGKLIREVKGDRVHLAWEGRQPDLFADLPAADVRWLGERLAAISSAQWNDAFRAAGYDAREKQLLHGALEKRIGEAVALSPTRVDDDRGALAPQDAGVDDRPRT